MINFKGTTRTKSLFSNTALHCKTLALLGGELLPCLSSGKSITHLDSLFLSFIKNALKGSRSNVKKDKRVKLKGTPTDHFDSLSM